MVWNRVNCREKFDLGLRIKKKKKKKEKKRKEKVVGGGERGRR